jgi:hypothetical protein
MLPAQVRASDAQRSSYTAKEADLRMALRRSYADNLTWQRAYALEIVGNALDVNKAHDRLIISQNALVNILNQYYGDDTANLLTNLFTQYTQRLSDYATIARDRGDKTAVNTQLHDNASATADAINKANMNLPQADLTTLFMAYNALLTAEVDGQAASFGSIDAAAMDATFDKAMDIADMFAFAIMKQYPSKFW